VPWLASQIGQRKTQAIGYCPQAITDNDGYHSASFSRQLLMTLPTRSGPPSSNMLTVEIEASKFPLSPRIERLKAMRAKLRGEEPPATVADAASKRKARR
jgi:hypothetical protein